MEIRKCVGCQITKRIKAIGSCRYFKVPGPFTIAGAHITVELLCTDKESRDWKIMFALNEVLFISRFFSINIFYYYWGEKYVRYTLRISLYRGSSFCRHFFFKARVSKQENEANASLGNIKKQPHNNKPTQQGALFDRLICGS